MMRFYLIRHGLKESTSHDPSLTEIGLKQAETTADHLKEITFKEIVASPKKRTQQTAKKLAEAVELSIITDNRLQERMEWEADKTLEEFVEEWYKTDKDRTYLPTKGSSSYGKGEQMRTVLDDLSEKHRDGNVAIVTHGGAIGDLLRHLFDEEKLVTRTKASNDIKYIDIFECSITVIEKDGEDYQLIKFGDTSHLPIPLT